MYYFDSHLYNNPYLEKHLEVFEKNKYNLIFIFFQKAHTHTFKLGINYLRRKRNRL